MHEVRGPGAPCPDDWGIADHLPQTTGLADPQTGIEQAGKLARGVGAGLDSSFGTVIKVGTTIIVVAFAVLVLALLVT